MVTNISSISPQIKGTCIFPNSLGPPQLLVSVRLFPMWCSPPTAIFAATMVGVGYHVRRDTAAAVGERIWPRAWMGLTMPPSRRDAIQSRALALLGLASNAVGSSVQRGRGQRIFEEDEDVTSRAPPIAAAVLPPSHAGTQIKIGKRLRCRTGHGEARVGQPGGFLPRI
jgi:hypothetical protein